MTQQLSVSSSATTSRTLRKFTLEGGADKLWAALEAWAPGAGYNRSTAIPPTIPGARVYQKGTGLLVAPMMLEVAVDGDQVTLQGWVRMGLFVRLMSFFILPAEMPIASGGFRAVLPRNIARKGVNQLLVSLGQPEIP